MKFKMQLDCKIFDVVFLLISNRPKVKYPYVSYSLFSLHTLPVLKRTRSTNIPKAPDITSVLNCYLSVFNTFDVIPE